nr:hypothetical protein [Actinomycetota bacterium]
MARSDPWRVLSTIVCLLSARAAHVNGDDDGVRVVQAEESVSPPLEMDWMLERTIAATRATTMSTAMMTTQVGRPR